jgi:alpha-tubulin suppressor-like RCC1 family protein
MVISNRIGVILIAIDRYLRRHGEVLTFGSGDCGQLAHGVEEDEDVMVKYPRVVHSLREKKVCGIACGGLHNAVFTESGHVFTWGCNDDASLGRDGDENMPILVQVTIVKHTLTQKATRLPVQKLL